MGEKMCFHCSIFDVCSVLSVVDVSAVRHRNRATPQFTCMRPTDHDRLTIPQSIRQLRVLRGFSQEYVAHLLGISQRAYSKLERAETRMTVERLRRLCEIFEVHPNEILVLPP